MLKTQVDYSTYGISGRNSIENVSYWQPRPLAGHKDIRKSYMAFFHMQMHPDEDDQRITAAIAGINLGFIGLDFDISRSAPNLAALSLNDWQSADFEMAQKAHTEQHGRPGATRNLRQFHELKVGDIGLVRGGATPIALVRITGAYQFEPKPQDGAAWFRHRFPIQIMEMYDDYVIRDRMGPFTPPSQGTFQLLNGNSSTEKAIKRWLDSATHDYKEKQMKALLETAKQIILYGPPGTGKTRQALELAASVIGEKSKDTSSFKQLRGTRWNIVQFHAAYNYEDFVRGVRVVTQNNDVQYVTKNGQFARMAERAESDPNNSYVLIIDEINRANLAGVLGELIYGLEYRGESVDTPYELGERGSSIVIPNNLLIIGTMNTADRSIGHIDYAIRRRFAFVECMPNRAVLTTFYSEKEEKLKIKALTLFDTVAGLFAPAEMNGAVTLSHDFSASDVQLGHSYFLAETAEDLERKLHYQVKPILNEYLRDGVLTERARDIIERLSC